jgi:hypothetical protein
MRQYKDLAVKYRRIGVFNHNGLRADCKMDCWYSARASSVCQPARAIVSVSRGRPALSAVPRIMPGCVPHSTNRFAMGARTDTVVLPIHFPHPTTGRIEAAHVKRACSDADPKGAPVLPSLAAALR